MAIIKNLESNQMLGEFKELSESSIMFKGQNNRLLLGKNVVFKGVKIQFLGSDASIEIADGCHLRGEFIVGQSAFISIGANTRFNKPCVLRATGRRAIRMGEGCLMANVRFDTADSLPIFDLITKKQINSAEDVFIGDRVWIAENVLVLKGSVIDHDSVIGAGAVVEGNIPAHVVAAGSPIRVVREGVTWSEKRL
jgi:acetyltransferase-like isoleucine patch superfamily enzyme